MSQTTCHRKPCSASLRTASGGSGHLDKCSGRCRSRPLCQDRFAPLRGAFGVDAVMSFVTRLHPCQMSQKAPFGAFQKTEEGKMRLAKTKLLVAELETLEECSTELLSLSQRICDALANVSAMVTMARRLKATERFIADCGQKCDKSGKKPARADRGELPHRTGQSSCVSVRKTGGGPRVGRGGANAASAS